ncbi:MAG: hypothetical protein WC732_05185 [Candidatus Omnitrophota bacterium]
MPVWLLKAGIPVVFFAGLLVFFWILKIIFSKSLLLGMLFVFFALPFAFRCLLSLLMLALPLFFSFSAKNRPKGRKESIDVPFKVLD